MNKILAIIGSHPRTRDLFDFNRTDTDVWVFNESMSGKIFPRADVVFQMHAETIWRNPANRNDPHHFEWLKKPHNETIYMQGVYADVPSSRRYPLEDILSMIGNDPNHFLTSSVPQAMALAAYLECYERVEIYGVAMETNTEYQFQREGVAYWYGYLKGKGIDVYFADSTFEAPLYGYEGQVVIEYEQITTRMEELTPLIMEAKQEYTASVVNMNGTLANFVDESTSPNEQAVYVAVDAIKKKGDKLGFIDGQYQENQKYKEKADMMRVAAGDHLFSRQEFESSAKTLTDKVNQTHVAFVSIGTQLGNVHNAIKAAPRGSDKRRKLAGTYRQILAEYLNINNQMAIYRGAASENFRYMQYLDKHIKAAGGSKSETVMLEAMQNA